MTMNVLEFNTENQILKIDLSRPNIFFSPSMSISESLFQMLGDVISAKKPGLYNLSSISKGQFELLAVSLTETLDSDLKLTAKSKTLALLKKIISEADETLVSEGLLAINEMVEGYIDSILGASPLFDYNVTHIDSITLLKEFTEFYIKNRENHSPDYLLFSELKSLTSKALNTITVINGYPRTMNLLDADQILEQLQKASSGVIVLTYDVNFMMYAASCGKYNCYYLKDDFFHKMRIQEDDHNMNLQDCFIFFNELAITEKCRPEETDVFLKKMSNSTQNAYHKQIF